ncbi:hypothetical protein EGW08_022710, partial [Elysia chlorotica]
AIFSFINRPDQQYVYKDAVVFSVHKFVGGISTPGVLIAKKKLFKHPVPDGCGGGTIFFVRRDHHRYLQEPESREEGGTPAIVESIRAGLVVQLRETVGVETIHRRDQWLLSEAQAAWSNCPELIQLGPGPGPESPDKLPIFSFLVLHRQTGRFLHHNFVATILNDVFGIQARGGCACAGPYAMDLLGLDEHMAEYIENLIAEDSRLDRIHLRRLREYSHREILRPGFVRLNLPYFMTEECLQFVLEAVKMTAEHAWMLLPQYLFNPETAEWRQKHFQTFKDRKWLGHISYQSGHMKYHEPRRNSKGPLPTSYQDCLAKAKKIFADAKKLRLKIPDQSALFDADAGKCRWFCLPSEANACLLQQQGLSATPLPVHASQDELPFFPGRLDKSIAKPNSHQREFSNDSVTTDKALVNNHRVYEISQDSTSKMAVCIDKTQKLDEKIKSAGREGYNSVTNNVSRRESDLETESASNKNGHMSALEDALKYADSLLKTCGTSDTAKAVDDVMNTIWKNFDPNNPQYVHMKESKNTVNHSNNGSSTGPSTKISSYHSSSTLSGATTACPFVKKSVEPFRKDLKNRNAPQLSVAGAQWFNPPKQIFKAAVTALEEYSMLSNGDKVLVCLSGGKDSLSLLHTLRQYQFYAKGKGILFEFGAVTVDPMTASYDPSPLKQYLASLKVPYFYESQCILETAEKLPYECASICSFCSRMKRGRIYAAARREGFNVLALGQHLDDLTESFLMSFFHNGNLNTMKAHYTVKQGDLRVIRPFVYVREADLRTFAEQHKLPVIAENCPACFEAPKERHRTKQLLAAQEVMFPQVYSSMMAALKPLMARGASTGEED